MFRLTLVSLFLSLVSTTLAANSCVIFDANFNLLALNYGGKDYDAGTQDSWGSGTPNEITASGRPKFDTDNVSCYMAQFYNAIYVLNGDKSDPSAVYIYDAGAKSWSTQKISGDKPDMSSAVSILDHDTNVFFTLSQGKMWSLTMDNLKAKASDTAISWDLVGNPSNFKVDGYQPVMGLAQNHIHFLNTNGAGKASIFVIHFAYWQPEIQSYSGPEFPAQHGQIASFFKPEGVQQEFAFIPDDASGTFVINVENNSTVSLAAPPAKDAAAVYAASTSALVSSSSVSGIQFLAYNAGGDNKDSKWAKVAKLDSIAPASGSTGSTGGSGSGLPSGPGSATGGTKPTGGATTGSAPKPSGSGTSSGSNSGNNGAASLKVSAAMVGAVLLGGLGVFLI